MFHFHSFTNQKNIYIHSIKSKPNYIHLDKLHNRTSIEFFEKQIINIKKYCPTKRETSLVMYIFTSDKQVQDLFVNATQSGSMCINDTIMQYVGKSVFFFFIYRGEFWKLIRSKNPES